MTALFIPTKREERGEERYSQFELQFADCDLILVEGDLYATAPRIEVWRSVASEAPYAASDPAIVAVISDDSPSGLSCPVWGRADVAKIADQLRLLSVQKQDGLLRPSGNTRSK